MKGKLHTQRLKRFLGIGVKRVKRVDSRLWRKWTSQYLTRYNKLIR